MLIDNMICKKESNGKSKSKGMKVNHDTQCYIAKGISSVGMKRNM